ncbi:hypothetical protein EVAR_99700_1 [Eumeta japonica]|uniref:Uncharacterized protein n=1 Tax=Eumeta variegata TaxID=151549 RepID=A0A4C2AB67_EUMVA|nr:hypothetical protein EVAR_99700_1 [Eumeta japonica]
MARVPRSDAYLLVLRIATAVTPVVKIGCHQCGAGLGGRVRISVGGRSGPMERRGADGGSEDKQGEATLPHSTLVYDIQYAPGRDTFKAYKKGKRSLNSFRCCVSSVRSGAPLLRCHPTPLRRISYSCLTCRLSTGLGIVHD